MPFVWFDKNNKIYSVTETKDIDSPDFIFCPIFENIKSDKSIVTHSHKLSTFGEKLYANEQNKQTTIRFNSKTANKAILEKKNHTRAISILESPSEWSLQEILEMKYRLIAEKYGYTNFWHDEFFDQSIIDKSKSSVSTSTKGVSIPPGGSLVTNKLSISSKMITIYVESDKKESIDVRYRFNPNSEFKSIEHGVISISEGVSDLWLMFKNIDNKSNTPLNAFGILS
jgi:hypothetical protein